MGFLVRHFPMTSEPKLWPPEKNNQQRRYLLKGDVQFAGLLEGFRITQDVDRIYCVADDNLSGSFIGQQQESGYHVWYKNCDIGGILGFQNTGSAISKLRPILQPSLGRSLGFVSVNQPHGFFIAGPDSIEVNFVTENAAMVQELTTNSLFACQKPSLNQGQHFTILSFLFIVTMKTRSLWAVITLMYNRIDDLDRKGFEEGFNVREVIVNDRRRNFVDVVLNAV